MTARLSRPYQHGDVLGRHFDGRRVVWNPAAVEGWLCHGCREGIAAGSAFAWVDTGSPGAAYHLTCFLPSEPPFAPGWRVQAWPEGLEEVG